MPLHIPPNIPRSSSTNAVILKSIEALAMDYEIKIIVWIYIWFLRVLCIEKDSPAGEVNKSQDTRVSMPRSGRRGFSQWDDEGDAICDVAGSLRKIVAQHKLNFFYQFLLQTILVTSSTQWPPTVRKRLVRSRIDSYPSGREARAHAMLSHLVRLRQDGPARPGQGPHQEQCPPARIWRYRQDDP